MWGSSNVLHLLWLLIPLTWLMFRLLCGRERKLALLADQRLLLLLLPHWNRRRARTRMWLWLLALALMLVALARPRWGFHWQEVRRKGLDIIIVLDTSRSMLTQDIKPNRMTQAKWGIKDLVNKIRGDRIGLLAFAGSSFLQCPLTMDYVAFRMTLDDIYVGIIPRGGTAIAQALRKAANAFDDKSAADRVIIMISDGEDHEGNPMDVADMLKEKKIRVFAIGVGTQAGDLVPGKDKNQFHKNRKGEVVKSALNEQPLRDLATATDGFYVRSAPGDFGLEHVYEQGIRQLKRDDLEARMSKIFEERFAWFLGVAFLLLLLEACLSEKQKLEAQRI